MSFREDHPDYEKYKSMEKYEYTAVSTLLLSDLEFMISKSLGKMLYLFWIVYQQL